MLQLLLVFFNAFKKKDVNQMISCYHPEVEFIDPAFGVLKGEDVFDLWKMVCKNAKNFDLEYWNIHKVKIGAKASYEAWYTFSKTGRNVYTVVDSTFEFADGKIIRHSNDYDLHHWARQAFGFTGRVMGGTTYFKNKIQEHTSEVLNEFKKK